MRKRFFIRIALLLVAVGLGAGAWSLYRHETPAAAPAYATATVQRGELIQSVSATGALSPVVKVQVGSQVSGTIERLLVDFNDSVRKGQVVAQIEPSLFRTQVTQAEANLRSAEATRDKAWVGVLDARRQLVRMQTLSEQRLVATSEADAARFAEESAVVEHQAREAAVAQAGAALEQTKVNLAHTTIYAPISGVVISRDVSVGQTVAASLQAPTLFAIAQDLRRMQIEADVDESFIGQIKDGQSVNFTVFAYPERNFQGRVAQIRLNPKVDAGVVKYNCVIAVDNADLALKPGMTATVAIEVARRDAVLKVPSSALRFVPDLPPEQLDAVREKVGRGEAVLWTPTPAGLEPRIVTVGLVGETETEIGGEGLQPGLRVAVPHGAKKNRPANTGHRGFGVL